MITPGGSLMDSTVLGHRTSSSEHRSDKAWLLHNRRKAYQIMEIYDQEWLTIPWFSWREGWWDLLLTVSIQSFETSPEFQSLLWQAPCGFFSFPDTSDKFFKGKTPKGCYYWASSNIYQHNWLLMQLLLWGAQKAEIQAPGFMKAAGNWYGSCQRWEKLRKSWSTPTINVFPKNACLFLFSMHGCFACMYICTICFRGALRVQRRVADALT